MLKDIKKSGIINKAGAWFTFLDPETGELLSRTDEDGNKVDIKINGQAKLIPFLKDPENKDVYDKIVNHINKEIYG